MLRLKLRREHPDRVATLHQRAARWYERNGMLTEAVRHAAQAGDWQLAAGMVIEDLAIGQILERGGQVLAGEFAGMPPGQAWIRPEPHLVLAAIALSAGRPKSCAAALDAADGSPDKLIGAIAYLVAACGALAEGRAAVVMQIIARARSGCSVPAWLDHRLSLVQSRAYVAAGDIQAALTAAEHAGASLEAAVTLAHAWAAAGDSDNARRVLAPVLAAGSGASDRVRVQAWLVDARLSHDSGDRACSHRSLASALRLAEPEQLRLPFVVERGFIGPVLRRNPELVGIHWCLLPPALRREQLPALPDAWEQAAILAVEPLSEREREVLRHVSGLLSRAEIATEMRVSVNTVKTHIRNIYRKLATTRRGEAVRRARQLGLI